MSESIVKGADFGKVGADITIVSMQKEDYDKLLTELLQLRAENSKLQEENERLKAENSKGQIIDNDPHKKIRNQKDCIRRLSQEISRLKELLESRKVCEWRKDEKHNADYRTDCGEYMNFLWGNLQYNKYKFCQFCGLKIREVK